MLSTATATATPQVVVEISADAEKVVDARFTRRMLQIELGDLRPRRSEPKVPGDELLYFRVVVTGEKTLAVELWNRGEPLGKRSISVSKGSSQLHSRRIVLAAAELARRAPRQLQIRSDQRAQALARCELAENQARLGRAQPRLRLDAGFGFHTLSLDGTWMAGPELRPGVQWSQNTTLSLQMAVLQGRVRNAEGQPYLRWVEFGVAPGHEWELAGGWRGGISLPVTFATMVLRGAAELDGVPAQSMTWSGRAALAPSVSGQLTEVSWLQLTGVLGWTLRDIELRDSSAQRTDVGGPWLGAVVGISVGPRHE